MIELKEGTQSISFLDLFKLAEQDVKFNAAVQVYHTSGIARKTINSYTEKDFLGGGVLAWTNEFIRGKWTVTPQVKKKEPIVRWKWVSYDPRRRRWSETASFLTEDEASNYSRQFVKLEYTRTEFPE